MKFLVCVCFVLCNLFGAWVMFSDSEDTYIYNNQTGDIYIKYKKGGKNYEDTFIKMPSGIIPKNYNKEYNSKDINPSQGDLLDKLQNIQNSTLNKVLE